MSVILGLNAFHGDSSACLIIDGILVAAAEEERFLRIKHWAGFPSQSIEFCLEHKNISLKDVDVIAVNSDPKTNFFNKLKFSINNITKTKFLKNRLKVMQKKMSLKDYLNKDFPSHKFNGLIERVEHHYAHLVSAHTVSPFSESITVSIDGLGDFVSTAWGIGINDSVDMKNKIYFPHSLGIFYEAITHFLGFKNYGDEYKVMGLAPYGKPSYMREMEQAIKLYGNGTFKLNLKYFSHQNGNGDHTWEGGIPKSGDCFSAHMSNLLGPPRTPNSEITQHHMDIAHSVQKTYENAFFNLLNALHSKYKIDNLTIAGGCGMNSVANGKIYRRTAFKRVYIQSAAGDAGGAIGAAYTVANTLGETKNRFHMDHAYWGPSFSDQYNKRLLMEREGEIEKAGCGLERIEHEEELCERTAQAISEGQVIGWFQGRMEWGPRALGNRSILCDARRADMKEILNIKIKRRESFRPFAPSILREKVSEWFEEEDDVPFMMQVFQIHKNKRKTIPAVTHVDGSGRLQTVSRSTNPRYYKLIAAFDKLTGVPILLNTSFNENEPVVCRPEEALDTFLRTKMDLLVLGNWIVHRRV
jgi:carbamoyltransferase